MDWGHIWKGTVAAIGTGLTWFFGEWDLIIRVLVAFISLDILTGILAAYKEKRVDSEVCGWGLWGKVGILVIVGIGNVLDLLMSPETPVLRTAIGYWYIGREGISLLENFARLNVPIPPKILDALAQLKGRGGDTDGKV